MSPANSQQTYDEGCGADRSKACDACPPCPGVPRKRSHQPRSYANKKDHTERRKLQPIRLDAIEHGRGGKLRPPLLHVWKKAGVFPNQMCESRCYATQCGACKKPWPLVCREALAGRAPPSSHHVWRF